MGWSVRLEDPVTGETLEAPSVHFMRGSTYAMGGTAELWLSVTYNYSGILARALAGMPPGGNPTPYWDEEGGGERAGFRKLYGHTGAESLPHLDSAIAALGDDATDDYWEATEGNAKRVLCQLKAMAQMRPDGIWDGD